MTLWKRADGIFSKILLEKENGLTFLCLKEKLQKKQTSVPLDCSRVWKPYTAKPTRLCAKAQCWSIVTIRLAKGYFAARGSLDDFDRMKAFLLVRQGNCISPKSLFDSLGACNGSSVVCCSTGSCAKAYWGLNKTVGISVVPSAHPREAKGFHTNFITAKNRERRNSFRQADSSEFSEGFRAEWTGFGW